MKAVEFPQMYKILKPKEGEEFAIRHFELSAEEIKFMQLRDMINRRREYAWQKPGTFVKLVHKSTGTIMMSDTQMERNTNKWFIWAANGDVLIGGLGLGMILLAAQEKEEVKSITVVELHQEIIDLVASQLPLNGKASVICGDVFEWYPPKGTKYDTIYFDIWNDSGGDNYEDMKKLNRRFARRLNRDNPDCWMSSWRYKETKRSHFEAPYWES